MYPELEASYKEKFPFKLGTTSFIYPDSYETNVRLLAPYLDEIELLFLESDPESLPKKKEITGLVRLKEKNDISYNIHLPYDVDIGHPDPGIRRRGMDTIKTVVNETGILEPSTLTLHLYAGDNPGRSIPETRRKRLKESLVGILSTGFPADRFSVETLSYPFAWIEDIVFELGLSICLDVGHLFLFGYDPVAQFEKYKRNTRIIHLHGVRNRQDHLGLDVMSFARMKIVTDILKKYTGVVSLEVFSYDRLKSSLRHLTRFLQPVGGSSP
jgi:sugar phosphate isomerase/epimerase